MFQRQVRFQIDLSDVTNTNSPRDYLFAIIFTLHSGECLLPTDLTKKQADVFKRFHLPGNIRRFRRVCEHIQTQMCARKAPSSPRATRKFNTDLSESSSCGSDTSERLSPYVNLRNVSQTNTRFMKIFITLSRIDGCAVGRSSSYIYFFTWNEGTVQGHKLKDFHHVKVMIENGREGVSY